MRRTVPVLFLALALLGVLPAVAEEAPAPASPAPAVEEPLAPADLNELFGPEPVEKIGFQHGPCTVSVTCLNGTRLKCSGQSACYWNIDRATWPGYVECDGRRTTCSRTIEP